MRKTHHIIPDAWAVWNIQTSQHQTTIFIIYVFYIPPNAPWTAVFTRTRVILASSLVLEYRPSYWLHQARFKGKINNRWFWVNYHSGFEFICFLQARATAYMLALRFLFRGYRINLKDAKECLGMIRVWNMKNTKGSKSRPELTTKHLEEFQSLHQVIDITSQWLPENTKSSSEMTGDMLIPKATSFTWLNFGIAFACFLHTTSMSEVDWTWWIYIHVYIYIYINI